MSRFSTPSLQSRQTSEKLPCLYENLMSNNFRRTAVLKKYILVSNKSFTPKDSTEKKKSRALNALEDVEPLF